MVTVSGSEPADKDSSRNIMSGQLSLLTPISSPMVTRPTSPTVAASRRSNTFEEFFPTDPAAAPAAAASAVAAAEEGLIAAGAAPAPSSPNQHSSASSQSMKGNASSSGRSKQWKSPPCCDGCGAAKTTGGRCSGCGGRFCTACMGIPAPITIAVATDDTTPNSRGMVATADAVKEPCNNCSSLCNNCKPVACCFCKELRQQAGASRLCEACAGVCDACQRAACDACRAEFNSCGSCGYAACEDCSMQLQLQNGPPGAVGVAGTLVGPSGATSCWCAPPLRMASNVRHVSNQRFQMAQLHPSFLASTMEAAGLRDADYDEDDISYEEDDVIMGHMATDTDPDAAASDQHHDAAGHRPASQGSAPMLCAKTLEATIGSLPGWQAGHLTLPLSPSSSTHSSVGHYGAAGAHSLGAHGLTGVLGYAGGLRHPEHTLRGWLDSGC